MEEDSVLDSDVKRAFPSEEIQSQSQEFQGLAVHFKEEPLSHDVDEPQGDKGNTSKAGPTVGSSSPIPETPPFAEVSGHDVNLGPSGDDSNSAIDQKPCEAILKKAMETYSASIDKRREDESMEAFSLDERFSSDSVAAPGVLMQDELLLYVGRTFASFQEFRDILKLRRENFSEVLVKGGGNLSVDKANARLKRSGTLMYRDSFVYAWANFRCTHQGIFKSKAKLRECKLSSSLSEEEA